MSLLDDLVRDALELCAIPAPTFDEAARAVEVVRRLEALDLRPARDAAGNVLVRLGGDGPALVVSAHLDTVFPASTPLAPRREGGRLLGPGIGDNSVALAALLALARILADEPPERPIVLAATTGEEGLGDLRGIKAVLDGVQATALISLEGHERDELVVEGVASARFRATYRGPGGHSWGDRGRPSAVHALVSAAHEALAAASPATVNVGVVHGGTSVNTIAAEAVLEIDLRSVEDAVVEASADRVARALASAPDGVVALVEAVGRRPGGSLPPDSPLLAAAQRARAAAGLPPATLSGASTEANAGFVRGLPSLCVGLTHGGNAHRTDEWIEVEPLADGLAAVVGLVRRW
jgi:acetylornithine deacetylase/succinyl-diaminopimelate desuccinylase-like protein